MKHGYVCEYYFEEKYLNRNEKRTRLITNLKPVPILLTDSQKNLRKTQLPTIVKLRNSPIQRNVQEDELQTFRDQDRIKDLSDINDSLLVLLGKKFQLKRYDTHAVFYALETNDLSLPKLTYCTSIDSDLHVKLFYAGAPIALPKWISQTKNARLTSRSMIENLPLYIQGEAEEHGPILEELSQLKLSLYIQRISPHTLSCYGTLPFRHTSSYSLSSTYHLYHF